MRSYEIILRHLKGEKPQEACARRVDSALGELWRTKKKKKKAQVPATVADMQWRGYQDLGTENFGMPLVASGYNPYWGDGMPLGVDASYVTPFGAMPFMGYPPGPFDVPFGGGMFPQDPFAAQTYMMPAVPKDLSELGMGMVQRPPGMNREEIEVQKADIRHKRGMDRFNESY
ncbi:hypothetical protein ZIOFF_028309 [Zingiber officinale]|uniref:Uncharacterized protein n=1 Tax=Zingiber officinale TaxID=94328 RepID=A0A8J5H5Y5_ZINOF|nr:hypothetical protein ZIOFF_028309 [Zingiber officinale]